MDNDNTRRDDELRFNRPDDSKLEVYYALANKFFDALSEVAPQLKSYFKAATPKVRAHLRSSDGGHLLFRPIGLEIAARVAVIGSRARKIPLLDAVHLMAPLPMRLEGLPFENVIWNPVRGVIVTKGKRLAIRLVNYMLGITSADKRLLDDYRRAHGLDPADATINLPARLPV